MPRLCACCNLPKRNLNSIKSNLPDIIFFRLQSAKEEFKHQEPLSLQQHHLCCNLPKRNLNTFFSYIRCAQENDGCNLPKRNLNVHMTEDTTLKAKGCNLPKRNLNRKKGKTQAQEQNELQSAKEEFKL